VRDDFAVKSAMTLQSLSLGPSMKSLRLQSLLNVFNILKVHRHNPKLTLDDNLRLTPGNCSQTLNTGLKVFNLHF
jgi:hypothetical protein